MKNALKTLSFFRNVVFLKWASQIVFLVGLLYIIWSYIQNAVVNLEQTNIASVSYTHLTLPTSPHV